MDLLGEVPISGEVRGDLTEWKEDEVEAEELVGVTSGARHTGTRLVLMSTAD